LHRIVFKENESPEIITHRFVKDLKL
jgi:hypothetical protein